MAGSVLGSVASGVVGGLFNSKAEKEFARGAAGAQQIFRPQPFQLHSNFFSINPQGQANHTPTGARQNQFLLENSNAALGRLRSFDRDSFAARLQEASDRVFNKREAQAFDSLESRLFNRAGASTGTQRQIADFQNDIADRRMQRALNAEIAADEFGRGRFRDFRDAFGMLTGFDDRRIETQLNSLRGGRMGLPMAVSNPYMAQAGAFQAGNTQAFGQGLGTLIGGGIDTAYNHFFNSGPAFGSPGGGFTQVPFTSRSAFNRAGGSIF